MRVLLQRLQWFDGMFISRSCRCLVRRLFPDLTRGRSCARMVDLQSLQPHSASSSHSPSTQAPHFLFSRSESPPASRMGARSLSPFLLWLLTVVALSSHIRSEGKPFCCTGYGHQYSSSLRTNLNSGAVYFSAHPVDGLLYQSPDLLHDLYVWKCVTTVVLTSGDRGMGSNFSQYLERGLQQSYTLMADLPIDDLTLNKTTVVRVGTHDLHSWSLNSMPNIQILYLRLPDGSPSGRGYDAHRSESLSKLYNKEIDSITSTDGNATYTLRDLKELIGFVLHERKPNEIHILNHKAALLGDQKHFTLSDHTDHIVSAKLVQTVVTGEKINATVKA